MIEPSAEAPTVSVVVANYNHARFLPRCLAAIAAQTRPPDEVIVIDDASTDDSLVVISRFAPQLPGFRLIAREVNRGVVAAMNDGLREARGRYVLFAAADDWMEPDLLSVALPMLARFPSAGLFSALTRFANEAGEVTGPFRTQLPLRDAGYIAPSDAARLVIEDDGWFTGNTTVVNRRAALEAGGYRPEVGAFTDMFLNITLALRHGACFVPRYLGVWRRMDAGLASTLVANPAATLQTIATARQLMIAQQPPFPPALVERWTGRWRFMAARQVVRSGGRREALAEALPPASRRWAPLVPVLASVPAIGLALAIGFLFLLLRQADVWPVLRRRVTWIWMERALEGAGR